MTAGADWRDPELGMVLEGTKAASNPNARPDNRVKEDPSIGQGRGF